MNVFNYYLRGCMNIKQVVIVVVFTLIPSFYTASAENIRNNEILYIEEDIIFIEGKRVYNVVENPPEFPGGVSSLTRFFQEKLDYPQEAYNKKIQGRVLIEFVIHEDGALSHFKVINDVHHLLAEEALRVAQLMPKWKPGEQKGEKVLVRWVHPITFKIENEYLSDEEILDYYLSQNVVSGTEYQLTELQERELFMFPLVKKKYLHPQIFTEQPDINVETFQQLESLSQEVLIHYYIEAVISFRERGTEVWNPEWYLVLLDENRNVISLIPYCP